MMLNNSPPVTSLSIIASINIFDNIESSSAVNPSISAFLTSAFCSDSFLLPSRIRPALSPSAAAGASGVLAAVNGAVTANGAIVALLTGLSFTIAANQTAEPVVGSNTYPDIQEGRIRVNGQMTVMFQDAVFRDYFINETEVGIAFAFSTGISAVADFVAMAFPRIKAGGGRKNDGERAIVQTIPFTALLPTTGGSGFAFEQSTLAIQDSLAV